MRVLQRSRKLKARSLERDTCTHLWNLTQVYICIPRIPQAIAGRLRFSTLRKPSSSCIQFRTEHVKKRRNSKFLTASIKIMFDQWHSSPIQSVPYSECIGDTHVSSTQSRQIKARTQEQITQEVCVPINIWLSLHRNTTREDGDVTLIVAGARGGLANGNVPVVACVEH